MTDTKICGSSEDDYDIRTIYKDSDGKIIKSQNSIISTEKRLSFQGQDLSKLESPVYEPSTTSSHYPSGFSVEYKYAEHRPDAYNLSAGSLQFYLKDYTKPIPPESDSIYEFDITVKSHTIKAYDLSGNLKQYTIDYSDGVNPGSDIIGKTWTGAVDNAKKNGKYSPGANGVMFHLTINDNSNSGNSSYILHFTEWDSGAGQIKPSNIYNLPTPSNTITNNTINILYSSINKYPVTINNQFYKINTFLNGVPLTDTTNSCNIQFPKVPDFVEPNYPSDTSIVAIWDLKHVPLTSNYVSMTIIGGNWWRDDDNSVKQKRLKMLGVKSIKGLTGGGTAGNYYIGPNTYDSAKSNMNNYYAIDQTYFRSWFSRQYMGLFHIDKLPPTTNPYMDVKIHFKTTKPSYIQQNTKGDYNLVATEIQSIGIQYSKNSIINEVNKILTKSITSSSTIPNIGVFYNYLSNIEPDTSSTLQSTTSSIITINGISINSNSIEITYKNKPVSSDTFKFTYRNYLLPADLTELKKPTNLAELNTNIKSSILGTFKNYAISNEISIDSINIETIQQDITGNIFALENIYTDNTLKTKAGVYITNKGNYPKAQWHVKTGHIESSYLYKSTDNMKIYNVTLPTSNEPVIGDLSYGNIYQLVDIWMKKYQNLNTHIKYNNDPINYSNIQFYNQPSGSDDSLCNFKTCSSIYTCPGFDNEQETCAGSGPSALAIYNTYMKSYGIGCVVGKPINSSAANGGIIDLDDLLDWSLKYGNTIYPEATGGAIMSWVVGTESSVIDYNTLTARISETTLKTNDTILYQYFDSFGDSTGMETAFNDILDKYGKNIVPLFAFCDIGKDSHFGNINNEWFGSSTTENHWWTSEKIEYIKTQTSTHPNIPNMTPGSIGANSYPVLIHGGAGQWASSSKIIDNIGSPHGTSSSRVTKILLSFGGELVPLSNLSSIDPDKLAQNIVNIIIKYGFDGIDFDLEGFSKSINDILWTTSLYGNVKRYFLEYESLIRADTSNKLGYGTNYRFTITDAPQPYYFVPIYWNARSTDNPYKGLDHTCYGKPCS